MTRYEVHVRIKHVEKARKGEVSGVIMPTTKENLERAREYAKQMTENIEVKIWDTERKKWIE